MSPALTPTRHLYPGQIGLSRQANFWVQIIVALGGMIVFADGLTRGFNEAIQLDSFEYAPHWGAYVLAAVTLPLCLLYASSLRIPGSEGLFLWFVLNTVTYTKDFAYLRLPGAPLFITDVVLAILGFRLFVWPRMRWVWPRTRTVKLLYFFWFAGLLAAGRGVIAGEPSMLIARDLAMVAYSVFLLVGAYMVRSWASVRRLFIFFGVGAALAAVNGLAWFLAYPDQRRFISYGVYVLVGFVGALLLTINGVVHKGFGWFAIALIGIGVLLANARTIFVELVILLGVILLLKASVQRRAPISRFKMLAWAASGAAFVLIVVSQMEAGSAFVARASEELVSGTVEYGDDPNAQFRLVAWAAALGRFTASPIVGEGFGVPFIFEHSDRDVRPHNTYLTVLYKTGLVGFLPLLLLLLYFYWNGWKALRRCNDQRSIFLYVLLLGHSALCLFGLLNLLLESPFLASMFWILMGVGIRTVLLLRKGSTEALQFTHV